MHFRSQRRGPGGGGARRDRHRGGRRRRGRGGPRARSSATTCWRRSAAWSTDPEPRPGPSARSPSGWSTSLAVAGVESLLQVIDDAQANAVGVLRGPADGESVLLYAPLDTYTTGDPGLDIPFAGPRMREDMLPRATVYDDLVIGLAAGNPKGHAACVLVAVEAMAPGRDRPPGRRRGGLRRRRDAQLRR